MHGRDTPPYSMFPAVGDSAGRSRVRVRNALGLAASQLRLRFAGPAPSPHEER